MAEYKNGVNRFGNLPVSTDNINPDVQTGRAVFVDEGRYANDSAYKARVDKYIDEGFHRVGGGESSGSGSGGAEPLIMKPTDVQRDGNSTYTTFDKTGPEVMEAFASGRPVYIDTGVEGDPPHYESIIACKTDDNGRTVAMALNMESIMEGGSPAYYEIAKFISEDDEYETPGYMCTEVTSGGSSPS